MGSCERSGGDEGWEDTSVGGKEVLGCEGRGGDHAKGNESAAAAVRGDCVGIYVGICVGVCFYVGVCVCFEVACERVCVCTVESAIWMLVDTGIDRLHCTTCMFSHNVATSCCTGEIVDINTIIQILHVAKNSS